MPAPTGGALVERPTATVALTADELVLLAVVLGNSEPWLLERGATAERLHALWAKLLQAHEAVCG